MKIRIGIKDIQVNRIGDLKIDIKVLKRINLSMNLYKAMYIFIMASNI